MTRQLAHMWDASRCVNCGACLVACASANYPQLAYEGAAIKRGLATNITRTYEEKATTTALMLTQCQQCGAAPCLVRCPVKAISRSEDGLVRTDEKKCIHCQTCVAVCPYGARWNDPVTKVPKSCLGPTCMALVAAGQDPACVQACPATARAFGDVDDKQSAIARRINAPDTRRIDIDKGTKPNFYAIEKA